MFRKPSKRKRRSPEEAREEILTIAERHLAIAGPDSVRLNAIADEMGVTHPALLKHFASRDALLEALLRRAGRRLRRAAADAVATQRGAELDVAMLFKSLDTIYREQGSARLSAWLMLAGFNPSGSGMFREAAETLHRNRGSGRGAPALEDAQFVITLVNLVAWSDALAGPAFRRAVDLPGDEATSERFRDWFAGLLRSAAATQVPSSQPLDPAEDDCCTCAADTSDTGRPIEQIPVAATGPPNKKHRRKRGY